jgi:hypothetical protein
VALRGCSGYFDATEVGVNLLRDRVKHGDECRQKLRGVHRSPPDPPTSERRNRAWLNLRCDVSHLIHFLASAPLVDITIASVPWVA